MKFSKLLDDKNLVVISVCIVVISCFVVGINPFYSVAEVAADVAPTLNIFKGVTENTPIVYSIETAKITDMHMTSNYKSNCKPVDTISEYDIYADKLVVTASISDAPYNTVIKAVWTSIASGEVFSTSKQDIGNSHSSDFYFSINNDDVLPKGSYKVELLLSADGSDGSWRSAGEVDFTVADTKSGGFTYDTGVITKAHMTTAIINCAPLDTVTSYKSSTEKLILTAQVDNIPRNTTLRFVWTYEDENILIDTATLDVGDETSTLFESDETLPGGGWPTGTYKVEIYIGSKTTPSGTVTFKITD